MKMLVPPLGGWNSPPLGYFLIFIFLLGLLFVSSVSALGVTGSKFMETMPPGSERIHTMTLNIEGATEPLDIQADIMGFQNGPDGAYHAVNANEDTSPYSARTYITLDRTQVHLTPGKPETIRATISLPQNAGSGGRYAMIYIHSAVQQQKSFGFISAVAVPVMITIGDSDVVETGTIMRVSVGDIATGQPFIVTTGFQNTGNHHYYGITNTVVISGANGVIATESVGPIVWAVVPGSTVDLRIPIRTPLSIGKYTVTSTVTREDGTILDSKTENIEVATPFTPPPTSTTITLTPQSEGVLVSPDGRYLVTFPAGSVLSNVDVTLRPLQLSMAPMGTNTVKLGSSIFTVEGLAGLLAKPATVRVEYSEDDLRAASGDLNSLQLARFDAGGNAWTVLPTTRDGDTLVTQSDRMGTWAVVSSQGGAGGGTGINTNTLMIIGGVIAVIVIAIAALLMRKKKNTT